MANMRMHREREVSSSDETCVFETPGTSGTGFGGGGDHPIPIPRIMTFCNGVKVPVFEAEEIAENPEPSNECSGNSPGIAFKQVEKFLDYLKCPICMDYLVEATAVDCGHIFCSSCLNQSTNMKQICPVCSTNINCRIRLFKQDLFLQSILNSCDDLPEVFQNLNEASKARMLKAKLAARKSIFLNIRDSLDTVMLTLRCKGFWATLANSAPSTAIQRHASQGWVSMKKFNFWIGLIVGTLITFWICTRVTTDGDEQINFFYYLYICITRFNGRFPDFLKRCPAVNQTMVDNNKAKWWTKLF